MDSPCKIPTPRNQLTPCIDSRTKLLVRMQTVIHLRVATVVVVELGSRYKANLLDAVITVGTVIVLGTKQ